MSICRDCLSRHRGEEVLKPFNNRHIVMMEKRRVKWLLNHDGIPEEPVNAHIELNHISCVFWQELTMSDWSRQSSFPAALGQE